MVNQPPVLKLLAPSAILYPGALMPPQLFVHDFETPLDVTVTAEGMAAALPYMRDHSLLPALPYDTSTDLYGPLAVRYSASDPQGRSSAPATQLLYFAGSGVLCPGPEVACAGDVCSVDGLCFPPGLASLASPNAGGGQASQQNALSAAAAVDATPPVIKLLGAAPMHRVVATGGAGMVMEARVTAGEAYTDPGATAFDDIDVYLTDRVSARGAAAVDTTNPTPPDAPLRIVYAVADGAGNEAARAERRIIVGCPDGRPACEGDTGWFCSVQAAACVGAPLPSPPRPAPVTTIQLVGPAVVTVAQFEPYGRCGATWLQELPCDRGVAAHDPVEGDVSAFVDACVPGYSFALYGLTLCGIDTSVPEEYTVTFSIVDSASSQRVAVSRTVAVIALDEGGPAAEAASTGGLGLRLLPVPGMGSEQQALVPRGQEYNVCTADLLQRGALCEPGVTHPTSQRSPCGCIDAVLDCTSAVHCTRQVCLLHASAPGKQKAGLDLSNGNAGAFAVSIDGSPSSAVVLACPPQDCLPLGCPGHEFVRKGLRGCDVTSMTSPIGTSFTVTFLAFDPAAPGRSVSATRTVTVVSPCLTGQLYCPDLPGEPCGTSPCSVRSLLVGQGAIQGLGTPDEAQPLPRVRFAAAIIPALTGVTAQPGKLWPQVSLDVTVPCGMPSPVPLQLCTAASAASSCGVVAEVLQAGTVVQPQAPLQLYQTAGYAPEQACSAVSIAAGTCMLCSADAISRGLCMAGWHELTYTARSPGGKLSSAAVIRVTVMQRLAAAQVAVVCTVRVPGAADATLSVDGLVDAMSGDSTATNEALWAAREVLQESMQAALGSAECAAMQSITGSFVPLVMEVTRADTPISSILWTDPASGILVIEVGQLACIAGGNVACCTAASSGAIGLSCTRAPQGSNFVATKPRFSDDLYIRSQVNVIGKVVGGGVVNPEASRAVSVRVAQVATGSVDSIALLSRLAQRAACCCRPGSPLCFPS